MAEKSVAVMSQVSTDLDDKVSFQVFQDVYNRITGKSERTTRMFFSKHVVDLENLVNLHHMVEQSLEQYTCVSTNVTYSLSYSDGKTERFSGIDRLKLHAPGKSVCVEQVELEYDFLLTLPQSAEPRPYKVVLGVRSEIGLLDREENGILGSFEKELMMDANVATGRLAITYIDLAVARSLEATFFEWYSSLHVDPISVWHRIASYFRPVAVAATRLTAVIVVSFLLISFWGGNFSDLTQIFKAGVISAAALMTANSIGLAIGQYVKSQVADFGPKAFIALSKADDTARTRVVKSSKRTISKAILVNFGIIGTGLLVNYIYDLLT